MLTRQEGYGLLCEYTPSDSLRRHGLAVEAAMRAMAERLGGDPERWGVCGLIHDFDYERYPSLEDHPYRGVEILRGMGVDEEFLQAVLGHGDHTGTPRTTPMAQTLYAVDELCGFMVAIALVRPTRDLEGLEWKSIKKKLKDKTFARAVDRDMMARGAEGVGMSLQDLALLVRDALQPRARELGLGNGGE